MYIFISHSSKNADIAAELCSIIESNGSECFLAPRNIRSGFEYAAEIINGIDNSDVMLLLLSEYANASPHILREIERAVSKSIPIIVYKLEDVVLSKSLEYFLMSHQWLNAEHGTHKQLLKCIDDLKNNTSTAISTAIAVNNNPKQRKLLPLIIGLTATITVAISVILFIILGLGNSENNDNSLDNETSKLVAQNTTSVSNTENNTSQEVTTDNGSTENTTTEDTTTEDTTTEDTTTEDTTTEDNSNNNNPDIKLGDTIVFGKYNDTEIYWKVIKLSEDGKEAVIISRDILTFKAFDSANSGKYGEKDGVMYSSRDTIVRTDMQLQADIHGNSSWKNSDIRAWLNSDKELVSYEGTGPIAFAMADRHNAYNTEAGFLHNFTEKERNAIKDTTLETKGNALYNNQTVTTTDKVFILSKEELTWLDNAGVSRLSVPTTAAIDKNTCYDYKDTCDIFNTDASTYWLREPVDGLSSKCYMVGHGASPYYPENIFEAIVCCDGYGIRPAMTVDLTSECINVIE